MLMGLVVAMLCSGKVVHRKTVESHADGTVENLVASVRHLATGQACPSQVAQCANGRPVVNVTCLVPLERQADKYLAGGAVKSEMKAGARAIEPRPIE